LVEAHGRDARATTLPPFRLLPHGDSQLEHNQKLRYKTGMTLKAIIHNAEEGGFWAEVPALPGCVTQGETLAEVKANLREAIDLWLSVDDETMAASTSDQVLEMTV
jgi:predicted RNase H-like HicB family nuclease